MSGESRTFSGTVEEIATKQTKQERANVEDTDGVLKPGMPADVALN